MSGTDIDTAIEVLTAIKRRKPVQVHTAYGWRDQSPTVMPDFNVYKYRIKPRTITLELTEEEAFAVWLVCGSIRGGLSSLRKHTNTVYRVLSPELKDVYPDTSYNYTAQCFADSSAALEFKTGAFPCRTKK